MADNSFDARAELEVGGRTFEIYRLDALQSKFDVARLPFSLKVLLENLLRNEDGVGVRAEDIEALATWDHSAEPSEGDRVHARARGAAGLHRRARCVVDLAAMRDAMADLGGDPSKINPLVPVELVIDHSVQVDVFGTRDAFRINAEKEFERNKERYAFLRWGQTAFEGFKVVPPDTGIVHQVNLEYLARVVFTTDETAHDGPVQAYPDTLVGTDSHTTMINGLGVLGWGVGGIEAEAAMLGQPMSMLIPHVVGFKLHGDLPEGATATDLVLTVTQMLREHGVVAKFVEFYGPGVPNLPLADRATIGNMSPEFGSTCAIFPIDAETLRYLEFSGRPKERIELVEAYAREQGLWHDEDSEEPTYSETLELDLGEVVPSLAGPKRPQDRVSLTESKASFRMALEGFLPDEEDEAARTSPARSRSPPRTRPPPTARDHHDPSHAHEDAGLGHRRRAGRRPHRGALAGDAGRRHGDRARPRPRRDRRDHVVHEHLQPVGDDRRGPAGQERRRARPDGQAVGQDVARPGLEGRHGVLRAREADRAARGARLPPRRLRLHDLHRQLRPAAGGDLRGRQRRGPRGRLRALSGNRNFEGRINPDVKMNYLASPPLCVAYALAGTMDIDLLDEPLGTDNDGEDVYLKDIWPSAEEVAHTVEEAVQSDMFPKSYGEVFEGDERWNSLEVPEGDRFAWADDSTYVRQPPFFEDLQPEPSDIEDIEGARVLAVLGDSVTTDHISPAGAIKKDSPAAKYLNEHGVANKDFNSYGARRGNHEVMMRGTFANIRLRNEIAGKELIGGLTVKFPEGDELPIYDAAMQYAEEGTPLVVLAGRSTARAPRATGPPRAPTCSASRR